MTTRYPYDFSTGFATYIQWEQQAPDGMWEQIAGATGYTFVPSEHPEYQGGPIRVVWASESSRGYACVTPATDGRPFGRAELRLPRTGQEQER